MNTSAPLCAPSADAAFGPVVDLACRDGFDFTLLFEQSVFVILPASLLLLAAPLRLARLAKLPVQVAGDKLRFAKLIVAGALAVLQLSLVGLWATRDRPARLDSISLAAACVSFASTLMSCALSYAEHARSPRPSLLLNVFLLVALLLDAATLRTVWLLSPSSVGRPIQAVLSACFVLRAALVVLEAREKAGHLIVGPLRHVYAPEETAGLYGRAVLAWVAPLLRTGFRRLLRPADLFVLDAEMGAGKLSDKFWSNWNKATPTAMKQKHRLILCCIVTLQRALIAVIVPRLALLAFTICQPLLLSRFLNFLDDPSQSVQIGHGLIGAYGLVYFGIAATQALYWHQNGRSVTMMRGVLVSAIFSKTTEMSITAADDSAALTLMSSDVDVIVRAMKQIHEFWANIIQIAIGTWLLSDNIGYAAAGPMIVSFIALIGTVFVSPLAKKYQVSWLEKTQKRVGITSAMIGHIKSIKMAGLSQKLSDTITALRVEEIATSRPFRIIGAITSSIAQVPLLLSPVVAFAMFQGVAARTGDVLDANRLFAALALIVLLAQPLFWMFEVVLDLSAAFGALGRIQQFLTEPARVEYREMDSSSKFGLLPFENQQSIQMVNLELNNSSNAPMAIQTSIPAIKVNGASFGWSPNHHVLSDISFTLNRGQLAVLLGPVASGKSTLLKGLLGEVPHATGSIALGSSRLSWCDQNPWILNQSLRDNIVGQSHFDQTLYAQVTKACELEEDFRQLSHGDMTVVGSKGLALSGGQKQRVALARAIYSRPHIALFDDIFSGLDNSTARVVFKSLFQENGLLKQWGTTVLLSTHSAYVISSADFIITLGRDGKISEQGTLEHLSTAGGYVQHYMANEAESNEIALNSEKTTPEIAVNGSSASVQYKAKQIDTKDDKRRQVGDSTVYRYYFGSIGKVFLLTLLALEVGWAFLESFPTVWLKFWADANNNGTNQKPAYYLGVYTALQIAGVLWFAVLIWFVLVVVAAKSGKSLHLRLLRAVVGAPLSLFTTTDLGEITTRFSQDIGILDNSLPLALVVTLASFFGVIAKAGLLAASSYYVAISFPFLGALYFYLQRGYLRTSRQLRLLDLEEKAPVYTQFMETLAGLATVRAFGWSGTIIHQNHKLVDRSQRPFYLLIMVQRWLVLVLDLTTTALALLIVGFAVHLRGSVSVSITGVSLMQLISLSETLNMLIQFWTSIETSIGAVARIKQFSEETAREDLPGEDYQPPAAWPDLGHVVVSNLTASYGASGSNTKALDGITLELKPGEKVGICGRTGSGKSSLFLSFLGLLDPSSGAVMIDSIPLSCLSRQTIRTRLITVSQDQFFLPGTVRENIDPFNSFSDDAIIDTLAAVGLWDTIERRGGLSIALDADTLSHGQKQLFFLGRAVLRKSSGRLVLLDEASSSLDRETEAVVCEVIKAHFEEHTVISIAHRLDTIVDFDRVVVLEKGRIIETGHPKMLLQDAGSKFKALWKSEDYNSTKI